MKKILLVTYVLLFSVLSWGQVFLSAESTINQDFLIGTTTTATLPTGWKADKNTSVRTVGNYSEAVTSTDRSGGNSLSSTAGNGIYNFGAGDESIVTERAVGGLSSSSASKSVNIYVQLNNNGAIPIDNLSISYDVEKYRNGSNAAGFSIQMYYSTDGSTWNSAGSDFLTSFSADENNNGYTSAPGATTSVVSKNLSQSLAVGSDLYLAWNYSVTSGTTTSNAQALGIDNVSITANSSSPSTSSLTITTTSPLTELNLDNASLILTLNNETFAASLQNSYFTLNNAPTVTRIESVTRDSDTEATINLSFDNTDFDVDINNFSITATADGLSGTEPITSNSIIISAFSAPLVTTNPATQTLNGNAVLNCTATSNGYFTQVIFQLSTDINLETDVTTLYASAPDIANDAENLQLASPISGLTIGQTYYFRAVATNTEGTTQGEILSFTSITLPTLIINEIDSDTPGTDELEFIELFDGGTGNVSLDGFVVVLFNGNGDVSYAAYDLDGYTTNAEGYFVIGNSSVANANITFNNNFLQNGPDAVALYAANSSEFPNGSSVTTSGLIDAVVYYTSSGSIDEGLLVLLNAGELQLNEDQLLNKTEHSLQRIPNGAGGLRNTSSFYTAPPTPGSKNFDNIWLGSSNQSWVTSTNWINNLPNSNDDIFIPGKIAYYPELSTNTTIRNITLEHNAQLNGQEYLIVTGTTTVQHQIDFSTAHNNLDKWQYFTSPFTGITAGDMLSSNERVDLYMIQYDNTLEPLEANRNSAWAWLEETSDVVSPGTGYAVTAVNDISETGDNISSPYYNMALSGSLVSASSNVTVGLSYNGANATDNNWNLIGNPFLAPIAWTSSSYNGNIQGGTAYIYDRTKTEGGNYISIQNGVSSPSSYGTYIPAMQGFFVSAAATGSIEIKPSARVNNTQNFYKSQDIKALLRIQLSNGTKTDETVIVFNEMAEAKFDSYDALKMLGSQQNPQIYTTVESGHKLVFNNTNDLNQTIDLQITAPTEGTYTIGFGEISGLFNDYNISLTDYKHQKSLSITDTQYQFEVDETNQVLNFSLAFTEKTGFNEHSQQSLQVYAQHGEIVIKSANDHSGTVSVYTLAGKKLTSQTVCGTYSLIDFNNKQGVYVVEHKGAINTTYHKVVINQ